MPAIILKEHHGKNHEVIDEGSNLVRNVYQDVCPLSAATKPEKCTLTVIAKLQSRVQISLRRWCLLFLLLQLAGALGNSAALALGIVTVPRMWQLASGAHSPGAGNYSYGRISEKNSPRLGTKSMVGKHTRPGVAGTAVATALQNIDVSRCHHVYSYGLSSLIDGQRFLGKGNDGHSAGG